MDQCIIVPVLWFCLFRSLESLVRLVDLNHLIDLHSYWFSESWNWKCNLIDRWTGRGFILSYSFFPKNCNKSSRKACVRCRHYACKQHTTDRCIFALRESKISKSQFTIRRRNDKASHCQLDDPPSVGKIENVHAQQQYKQAV